MFLLGCFIFVEDDFVLELGIEVEIVEVVYELLEMVVMFDEGELVSEVFGV